MIDDWLVKRRNYVCAWIVVLLMLVFAVKVYSGAWSSSVKEPVGDSILVKK
jgi:hypothetical protein